MATSQPGTDQPQRPTRGPMAHDLRFRQTALLRDDPFAKLLVAIPESQRHGCHWDPNPSMVPWGEDIQHHQLGGQKVQTDEKVNPYPYRGGDKIIEKT